MLAGNVFAGHLAVFLRGFLPPIVSSKAFKLFQAPNSRSRTVYSKEFSVTRLKLFDQPSLIYLSTLAIVEVMNLDRFLHMPVSPEGRTNASRAFFAISSAFCGFSGVIGLDEQVDKSEYFCGGFPEGFWYLDLSVFSFE